MNLVNVVFPDVVTGSPSDSKIDNVTDAAELPFVDPGADWAASLNGSGKSGVNPILMFSLETQGQGVRSAENSSGLICISPAADIRSGTFRIFPKVRLFRGQEVIQSDRCPGIWQ